MQLPNTLQQQQWHFSQNAQAKQLLPNKEIMCAVNQNGFQ